jgi:hypothetical protein
MYRVRTEERVTRKRGNVAPPASNNDTDRLGHGPLSSLKSQPGVEPGALRPCHHLGRPQFLAESVASWRRVSKIAIVCRALSSSRWSSDNRADRIIFCCFKTIASSLMLPRSFVRSDQRSEYAELKG